MKKMQVVILGAGYGGLYTALKLEHLLKNRKDCEILLIDQNDYHQLKTELYDVAAERKTFEDITIPLQTLLKHERVSFMRAEVTRIDFTQKTVTTTQGKVKYDKLVIALGSETEFFGIPGLKEHACMHAKKAALSDMVEPIETVSEKTNTMEKIEQESLKQAEERKKAKLRTRGPYRKAHVET